VACSSSKYAFDGGGDHPSQESRAIHEGPNYSYRTCWSLVGHSELKTTIPGLVSVFFASSLQNVFDYDRTDWSFTIPRTLAIAVYHTVTRIILPYIRTTQTSTQLSGSPPAHHHRATLSHVLHKLSINGTNPLCLQPETTIRNTIQHHHH